MAYIRNTSGRTLTLTAKDGDTFQVPRTYSGFIQDKFLWAYDPLQIAVLTGPDGNVVNPSPDNPGSPNPVTPGSAVGLGDGVPKAPAQQGSAGQSNKASREDHVHPLPSLDDLGGAPKTHKHQINDVEGLTGNLQGKADTKLSNVHPEDFKAKAILSGVVPETTDSVPLSEAPPPDLGPANARGNSGNAAREDHTHKMPTATQVGAAEKEHGHKMTDITDLNSTLANKADKSHDHTIAQVSGLQNALDSKSPTNHEHDIEQIKGLAANLEQKAPMQHKHQISDIDGLTEALIDAANSGGSNNGGNTGGSSTPLGNVFPKPLATEARAGNSQSASREDHVHPLPTLEQLGGASASHSHGMSEITGLEQALQGRSLTGHKHVFADVPGLQEALNLKADKSELGTGGGAGSTSFVYIASKPSLVGGPFEAFLADYTSSALSATAQTYQTYHFVKDSEFIQPQLYFVNKVIHPNQGSVNGPNAITIKCSVVMGGRVVPVTFDGDARASADARSITLQPGQSVLSDPVPIRLKAPGFHVRTRVSVNSGQVWPTNLIWAQGALGEGRSAQDFVDADSAPSLTSGSAKFGPNAVIAYADGNRKPAVMLFGSSSGTGALDEPSGPEFHYGYLARLCGNAGIHYQRSACSGDTLFSFNANWTTRRQLLLATNPHYVVQQLGSNDISGSASLATMQDRIRRAVEKVHGLGFPSILCTVTPNTVSNTNLAPKDTNQNNVRRQYNDWLRTKPFAGIYDIWDVAQVTDDANTGVWKSGQWVNADGLHPSPFAHQQVASALAAKASALPTPTR